MKRKKGDPAKKSIELLNIFDNMYMYQIHFISFKTNYVLFLSFKTLPSMYLRFQFG